YTFHWHNIPAQDRGAIRRDTGGPGATRAHDQEDRGPPAAHHTSPCRGHGAFDELGGGDGSAWLQPQHGWLRARRAYYFAIGDCDGHGSHPHRWHDSCIWWYNSANRMGCRNIRYRSDSSDPVGHRKEKQARTI